MPKILQIADTHIMPLKRHDEYRQIFSKIYKLAIEEKVDYIIHCGDIVHNKTQITPELVEMTTDFLKSLSKIAPTYIILGNHDLNLKNNNRQDAVTPIVDAIDSPRLKLLKFSGEVDIGNNIILNVLSRLDEEKWKKPTNKTKINIGLYHGAVNGASTDGDFIITFGEHNLEDFDGHDYVFGGDIHKTFQIMQEMSIEQKIVSEEEINDYMIDGWEIEEVID